MRPTLPLVVLSGLLLLAAPVASADTQAFNVNLLEGADCSEGAMCIEITAGNEAATGSISDGSTISVTGEHPIVLNVTNNGSAPHNLTFEGEAGNHSHDDPIQPGETVAIEFTTVIDVPAGDYAMYSGMGADRQLGMEATLSIQEGGEGMEGNETGENETNESNESNDSALNESDDGNGIPGPGAPVAAMTLAITGAAMAAVARERTR